MYLCQHATDRGLAVRQDLVSVNFDLQSLVLEVMDDRDYASPIKDEILQNGEAGLYMNAIES